MKQYRNAAFTAIIRVALFTGAWIETQHGRHGVQHCRVALFTGAWIETVAPPAAVVRYDVALFTGAWIETKADVYGGAIHVRRALYGRVD